MEQRKAQRIGEVILLQLLDQKDLPSQYKEIVKELGVPLLDRLDELFDKSWNGDGVKRGEEAMQLIFYFLKCFAFASAYAISCCIKMDEEARAKVAKDVVDSFRDELIACNKQMWEHQIEGEKIEMEEVKGVMKAFGIKEDMIEDALKQAGFGLSVGSSK